MINKKYFSLIFLLSAGLNYADSSDEESRIVNSTINITASSSENSSSGPSGSSTSSNCNYKLNMSSSMASTNPSAGSRDNDNQNQISYVYAYDITNQPIQFLNSFQDIKFGNAVELKHWQQSDNLVSFKCKKKGIYEITYSALIAPVAQGNTIATIRAVLDNNEIAGSSMAINLSNSDTYLFTRTFIVDVNAKDIFKLQFMSTQSIVQLIANNSSHRVNPSVSLVINKIN